MGMWCRHKIKDVIQPDASKVSDVNIEDSINFEKSNLSKHGLCAVENSDNVFMKKSRQLTMIKQRTMSHRYNGIQNAAKYDEQLFQDFPENSTDEH